MGAIDERRFIGREQRAEHVEQPELRQLEQRLELHVTQHE